MNPRAKTAIAFAFALVAFGASACSRRAAERAPLSAARAPRPAPFTAAAPAANAPAPDGVRREESPRWAAVDRWVRAAPDAALDWALRQPNELRLDAVGAVLIAAADDPAQAVRLAQRCCREDATFVREHGATLITVLATTGEFRAAARFAELGGPERAAWMRTVFAQWAQAQPAAARAAAQALNDDAALAAVAVAAAPARAARN